MTDRMGDVGTDRSPTSAKWATLGLYAATHAAVDAVCAGLLWRGVHDGVVSSGAAWSAFLIYNLLAFAVQPLVGIAVDRLGAARTFAALGGLMTAMALPVAALPHAFATAVVLAGLGNAVFHVGGGVVSLRFSPGRATPPGIYVAPGAAGLAWGIVAGRAGDPVWPFAVALAVLAVTVLALPTPVLATKAAAPARRLKASGVELVVLLLLFVIAVRSYVGMALALPWKSQMPLLVALTAGVVLGKALGGVLADRLGWRQVGVGALLVSVPLLSVGADSPTAGIIGVFIFNMTMPVTLVATAVALPRHEGFAFGLTCLALFLGMVPILMRWDWAAPLSAATLVAMTAVAAAALWLGLGRLLGRAAPRRATTGRSAIQGGYR